jgi:diaminopimelate decarboxylase
MLADHFAAVRDAFAPLKPRICFSVKCCQNLHILRQIQQMGSWFDIVSGGELQRVLEAGADPGTVVFAGVGKTEAEIRRAVEAGIAMFNIESEQEAETIAAVAQQVGRRVDAALRVNPDVDPKTHHYTTTGKKETKFGVDIERAGEVFRRFAGHPWLLLDGVHVHLGSPIHEAEPYVRSIGKTLELVDRLREESDVVIRNFNIGGGYGAHIAGGDAPPIEVYAEAIIPLLEGRGLQILMEPGRCIAATSAILLARVLYRKESGERRFVVVDAAMTDFVRPALYGAYHFIWPVQPRGGIAPPPAGADRQVDGTERVDVAGGICESSDFLARQRWLPPLERGDLLAMFCCGAYGMTMSSQYNSRARACEILVDGGSARLIRRRETYDDLVACERLG